MLQQMKLPKRLRTVHHPGNFVEIWMNNKRVNTIHTLNQSEQYFVQNFITNLEELGWNVLLDKEKE